MARKIVRIDAAALAAAGASSVLALEARALGGTVALARGEQPAGEVMAVTAAETADRKPRVDGVVGLVRVEGPLAQRAIADLCGYVDGYDAIEARLSLALESEAAGVLMVIDSPGGDVAGLEESVRRMRAAADKSGKRVVAYVDELAASAAYWIASGVADEVVVPASGHVGSIGCIGAMVDLTAAAEKDGAKWTVVRDPAGKAAGHPYGPVADVAEERLRGEVKAAATRFYKAVSKRRGMSTSTIRKMDGALFSGREAVDAGLADRVGTLEDAARAAIAPRKKDDGRKGAAQHGDKDMKLHAMVCAALGLDADTSDADAVEAFESAKKDILTATGAKSLAAVAGKVDALKERTEALVEKANEADALRAELAASKRAEADALKAAEVKRIVQMGVDARRIRPAKREEMTEKGMKHGADWLQSVVDELPVLVGAEPPPVAAKTGAEAEGELSPRVAERAKAKGVDPEKVVALRNKMTNRAAAQG